MQDQLTHDQLKSKFQVPVTFRDQKELGFGDEPFALVIEKAEDGDRVTREREAQEQAQAQHEAKSPLLWKNLDNLAIADCGCTKFKLCPTAIALSKRVRARLPGADAEYSNHRCGAMRQLERINAQ